MKIDFSSVGTPTGMKLLVLCPTETSGERSQQEGRWHEMATHLKLSLGLSRCSLWVLWISDGWPYDELVIRPGVGLPSPEDSLYSPVNNLSAGEEVTEDGWMDG